MSYRIYELELKSHPEVDEERQNQMPPKQQTDYSSTNLLFLSINKNSDNLKAC